MILHDVLKSPRNLGATAATFEGHGSGSEAGTGSLIYQFGRVTPFAGKLGVTMSNVESSQQNFAWIVKNPTTYIAPGWMPWTTQDSSVDYMWSDKNVAKNSDGKSIFDPSPIGWRVPISGVWSDMIASNISYSTTDEEKGFTYALGANSTYYPVTGYRHPVNSGTLTAHSAYINLWSSTPVSANSAYSMYITSAAAVNPATSSTGRSYGFALRSIREN